MKIGRNQFKTYKKDVNDLLDKFSKFLPNNNSQNVTKNLKLNNKKK